MFGVILYPLPFCLSQNLWIFWHKPGTYSWGRTKELLNIVCDSKNNCHLRKRHVLLCKMQRRIWKKVPKMGASSFLLHDSFLCVHLQIKGTATGRRRGKWPHMPCKEERSDEQLSDNSWCSGISSNDNNLSACIFSLTLKKTNRGDQVFQQLWYPWWLYSEDVETETECLWCGSVASLLGVKWFRYVLPSDYKSNFRLKSNRLPHPAPFKYQHPWEDEHPPGHKSEIVPPEDTQCW